MENQEHLQTRGRAGVKTRSGASAASLPAAGEWGRGRGRGSARGGTLASTTSAASSPPTPRKQMNEKEKRCQRILLSSEPLRCSRRGGKSRRRGSPQAGPSGSAEPGGVAAGASSPSTLQCDWTMGTLRVDELPVTLAPQLPPETSTPLGVTDHTSSDTLLETEHIILLDDPLVQDEVHMQEWMEYMSDDEYEHCVDIGASEAIDVASEAIDIPELGMLRLRDEAINFASEEPALLPDNITPDQIQYLACEDADADRIVKGLLNDLDFDWTSDNSAFLGRREDFVGPSGPTFTVEPTHRPLDIFLKFFDDEIFDLIVRETNRYRLHLLTKMGTQSRRGMKEINRPEMGIFVSILILQGLCPLSVEREYFKENGYLTLPYLKSLMSYERFVMLKRLLHFTDPASDPQTEYHNKLRKLGPLLDLLLVRFQRSYLPSRDIVIDESLLKWHGRLSFAQKIATKAAKVGIKSYELCESRTGYCWNFFIYTGKATQQEQTDRKTDVQTDRQTYGQGDAAGGEGVVRPTNATAQIVLNLVQPLLNKGHTLVMDNFYNSPLLARYLKANKTDCFGTLRVNREFVPEEIKATSKSQLHVGEMLVSYCRDLTVTLWRDNNLVALISTIHRGEVGGKEKYGRYKYKPQVVLDYNLSMGGVDKKDQLLASHPIERPRNQVWYLKLFRRLLNVSILNAYIIYRTQHPNMTQRQFRVDLANQLIALFNPLPIPRPLIGTGDIFRDAVIRRVGSNFARPFVPTNNHYVGEGASKYKQCVFCQKSRTKFICKQCHVSLCLLTCFERYHRELE